MRYPNWMGALLCLTSAVGAQQVPDTLAIRQQQTLDSLAAALKSVEARLDSLAKARPAAPAPARAPGAYMNVSFVGLTVAGWSTNPDVRSLEVGDHDPSVRGFSIPNAELALDGAVDPYLKGFTSIVYKLDSNGETGVELEEMYVLTTSLPGDLQLKVGQFFTEFGRQNVQHPHSWAFADQPLVLGRLLGGEGLRSQGARVSWLLPTPFYAEATLAVLNSAGGTTASFRSEESSSLHGGLALPRDVAGLGELLYVPRLATSLDLSANQTLLMGISGAMGPNNSGPYASTRIYGADVYWKWKSATARQGFPFVSFQGEALLRRYDAALRPLAENTIVTLPAEVLRDQGAYGQILWGVRPLLVAGLRAEYATSEDGAAAAFFSEERIGRTRLSGNLTWYPTEFSKFRVQYNHDDRAGIGRDHSLWLQLEFLLGAHAAHKF